MEEAKELEKILHRLKEMGWDLEHFLDKDKARSLVSYTIHAVKDELINTPQHTEFVDAVKSEMAHHVERWGDESHTPPHHYQMVLGYINGKLAKAVWDKDIEKFKHHLVTIAAVAGSTMKRLNEVGSEVNKWFYDSTK